MASIEYTTQEEKELFQDVLSGKTHLFNLPQKLYKRMKSEELFAGNPEKTRQKWVALFMAMGRLSVFKSVGFAMDTYNFGPLILTVTLFIPGILLALAMPKRTASSRPLTRKPPARKAHTAIQRSARGKP